MIGDGAQHRPAQARCSLPVDDLAGRLGDRQLRLSFVREDDHGCRTGGLWPNTPILVQPCDRFMGCGHYQLLIDGQLVVRDCFRLNLATIRMAVFSGSSTARELVDMTQEEFEDAVCGLVLAKLSILNTPLDLELIQARQIHEAGGRA